MPVRATLSAGCGTNLVWRCCAVCKAANAAANAHAWPLAVHCQVCACFDRVCMVTGVTAVWSGCVVTAAAAALQQAACCAALLAAVTADSACHWQGIYSGQCVELLKVVLLGRKPGPCQPLPAAVLCHSCRCCMHRRDDSVTTSLVDTAASSSYSDIQYKPRNDRERRPVVSTCSSNLHA